MTVLANVMTGAFLRDKRPEVARERAREAIEFVGLSAKEHSPARDLTTIDQRRLEMARALATEPRLLLLDEVMAGLNSVEIDQAVALVGKLSNRGLTIIIVEHVMRAVNGRCASHRGSRSWPEDYRGQPQGGCYERRYGSRLSEIGLRACRDGWRD
jgi:ABC-type branched-subunit amino acid transport system ATPase component